MSVSYKGLLNGNINPIDLAKTIMLVYGGDMFNIRFGNESLIDFGHGLGRGIDQGSYRLEFDEEFSPEVKALRPWERKEHRKRRSMHVMIDGSCAGDYADVATGPMTYVSLGHNGHCKEIINALVAYYGGYIYDEAGNDEWERLFGDDLMAANRQINARKDEINAKEAAHRAKREAEASA